MKFKAPSLKDQFFRVYSKLRLIACDLDYYTQNNFKKEITVTSVYRNDKGVHGYWRGLDVRVEHARKMFFTKKEIKLILNYINEKYPYDPTRPRKETIIYHHVGLGPHHFHCQVCWER